MRLVKSFILLIGFIIFIQSSYSKDYIIYSVSQQLNMGIPNQKLRKNFYVNMGTKQGVDVGTKIDVFRIISKYNPYDDSKRINYKVKIGTLSVLHAEDESSITEVSTLKVGEADPVLDVDRFMIGDHIAVSVD